METLKYPTETKAKRIHLCNFCGSEILHGTIYLRSIHVHDGSLYAWKTHKRCAEIAGELKMYDRADYGVTEEDFYEEIQGAYMHLMSNFHNEIYESEDFEHPSFEQQLDFVIKHYLG